MAAARTLHGLARLSPGGSGPLYRQVKRELQRLIERGRYAPGDALPSETDISRALGVSIGLTLGIATGVSAWVEDLVDPTLQMLRTIPFLALIPLFISWFGIDEKFKIALIASASAFPMYAYSYLGVRSVHRKVLEAARSFGLGGLRLVRTVVLPSALPNLLMALRICLSISVVGLIAAEQVGTTKGIGYLVLLAKQ